MLDYKDFFSEIYKVKKSEIMEHFADYKSVPTEEESTDWFIDGSKRALLVSPYSSHRRQELVAFVEKNNYPIRTINVYSDGKAIIATKTRGQEGERELDMVENLFKKLKSFANKETEDYKKFKNEFHTKLGKFLGYSDEDVAKFIDRASKQILPPQK